MTDTKLRQNKEKPLLTITPETANRRKGGGGVGLPPPKWRMK